ncbi:MAG: bifunctional demethylmenaquinone methyltransferase/2-methoxy-6-polyprenyl-1,4-benzoquinol methylase UbiE [Bacteroidetes bacterium]|nr:bifunctional demethylmenaquinone methyltransferase/2-methoxy-6-polyprenyl-1,4-benzoquinol methylase UbiE [Bacteroidota bacterium]MBS1630444.1 bifunctional demethylmenaquinone methyltransferase/2-methoxy-6-polyprenyl-1,4-benzoquinol methylase UbiE [Bacteroidota bacterium]
MDGKPTQVVPDAASKLSKKEQVAGMFDGIAPRYDLLNHLLSLGIDKRWRRKAIRSIVAAEPRQILDVATGTGDLAVAASKRFPQANITGVDISAGMLEIGRKKMAEFGLSERVVLLQADSEQLPFAEKAFDAVICAYGVRNFEHLEAGLQEMCRVMRPGGRLAILEFSKPKAFPFSQLYRFYFRFILPFVGRMVSRHSKAYTYLPESVAAFPEGEAFLEILNRCGFSQAKAKPLSFGITTLYVAVK